MVVERFVSLAVVAAFGLVTLVAESGPLSSAGFLVSGGSDRDGLVGGAAALADCSAVGTKSVKCPALKGKTCSSTKDQCEGAVSGQSNSYLCSTGTFDVCSDVAHNCGAGYNDHASNSNCTSKVIAD